MTTGSGEEVVTRYSPERGWVRLVGSCEEAIANSCNVFPRLPKALPQVPVFPGDRGGIVRLGHDVCMCALQVSEG